ncbi:acyltransferase-domain-containing protein [Amylocystis lapponica]|nr:acyltransferase-domain-containing protein [Amylocystis lapponica]
MNSLLSKVTVSTIGLVSKTFLNIGYCSSVSVNGLDNLREALESDERNHGRGVVTISNHISTLDDPVVWGVLPARWYLSSRMTRWTLGASDIMFTNPLFSAFFRKGQVLETFRGNGVFQPAVDTAIQKLNDGAWIQLFGEGKVNQPPPVGPGAGAVHLPRFKWGVGRILMEAAQPPVIIPMWLTGFDRLMPEHRAAPAKFFPRAGVALSVTFGRPVDPRAVRDALAAVVRRGGLPQPPRGAHGGMAAPQRAGDEAASAQVAERAWLGGAASLGEGEGREAAVRTARVRSAVTALVQRHVEALGREVVARQRCS